MREMFTVSELARRWGFDRKTVRNWIRYGRIEAIRTPGGQFRIPAQEVRRFENETEQEHGQSRCEDQ